MIKVGDIVRFKQDDWISGQYPLFKVVQVNDGYMLLEWVDDAKRKELEDMYYKDVMTMTESYPDYVSLSISIPKRFDVFCWDEEDFEVVKEVDKNAG